MKFADRVSAVKTSMSSFVTEVRERVAGLPWRLLLLTFFLGLVAGSVSGFHARGSSHALSYAVPGVPAFAAFTGPAEFRAAAVGYGAMGQCSVVVIAPFIALTAEHCSDVRIVITQDGIAHKARLIASSSNSDIAILEVDDLYCPCAKVAKGGVVKGEAVTFATFGGNRYAVTESVVMGIDSLAGVLTEIDGPPPPGMVLPVIATAPAILTGVVIRRGSSGGPLFVKRNGEWQVAGIASWAVNFMMFPVVAGSADIATSDLAERIHAYQTH